MLRRKPAKEAAASPQDSRTPAASRAPTAPRVDGTEAALVGALLALAAISWTVLSAQLNGMDMGRWTSPGPLGLFAAMWVVMLAAMMFPSVAPMVVAYNKIHRRRRQLGRYAPPGCTGVFVCGYLLAWTMFGVMAYALYTAAASLFPDIFAADQGGRYLAAGVILLAAAYQFTPAKGIALMKCRTPMDFVLRRMRHGYRGALRMGIEHGAWCVGCCWALMVALFALGVMSLGWMAVIGALIAVEKMLPWRQLANRGIAVALTAIAIGIALAPGAMAGVTA